jgi:hypothetical protein
MLRVWLDCLLWWFREQQSSAPGMRGNQGVNATRDKTTMQQLQVCYQAKREQQQQQV